MEHTTIEISSKNSKPNLTKMVYIQTRTRQSLLWRVQTAAMNSGTPHPISAYHIAAWKQEKQAERATVCARSENKRRRSGAFYCCTNKTTI